MATGPCLNPNCKSHGAPHPNCRCYGPGMAKGGVVKSVCETGHAHQRGCQYYADGGEVASGTGLPEGFTLDDDHKPYLSPSQPGDLNPTLPPQQFLGQAIHKFTGIGVDKSEETPDSVEPMEGAAEPVGLIAGGIGAKAGAALTKGAGEVLGNEVGSVGTNPPRWARADRARAQGFDPSKTYYHGTKADIESFDPSALGASTGAPSAKQGYFFATDPSTAGDYSALSSEREEIAAKRAEPGIIDNYNKNFDAMNQRFGKDWQTNRQNYFNWKGNQGHEDAVKFSGFDPKDPVAQKFFDSEEAYDKAKEKSSFQAGIDAKMGAYKNARLTDPEYLKAKAKEKQLADYLSNHFDKDLPWDKQSWEYQNALGQHNDARQAAQIREKALLSEMDNRGSNVLPVHLKMQNPYVHDFKGAAYRDASYHDIIQKAKAAGHDSVIFKNTYDPANPDNRIMQDIHVVFDPSQIRSKFAEFDPKKAGKAGLSFADGGMAELPQGFTLDQAGQPGVVNPALGQTPPTPSVQAPQSPEAPSDLPPGFELDEDKYGSLGQQAIAGAEGVAQGLAGPLAPAAERMFGVKPEDMLGREEQNPGTHFTGEIAGLVGGSLAGTGLGGVLGKVGEAIGAVGPASKIGNAAIRAAAENAVFQGQDEVSKLIKQDPNQSAQTALAHVGLAAALGGATGAAFGAVPDLWKAAVGSKVSRLIGDFKSRVNYHLDNPHPVDAMVQELGDHYAGLKAAHPDRVTEKLIESGQAADEGAMKSLVKLQDAHGEFAPALKDFERKFTTEVGGERVIDPGKVSTYMNQAGKPSAEIKQQMLENFLDQSERFGKTAGDVHTDLGLEAPALQNPLQLSRGTLGKLTPGAKLADFVVKRGLTNLAGEGLGASIGGAVGHAVGAGGWGAVIGEHALGPFFSSILPSITEGLTKSAVSAPGAKAAIDYAAAVAKGEAGLNKGVARVFKSGQMEAVASTTIDKDRARLDGRLKSLQTNENPLMAVGGDVGHYLPQHAQGLAATTSSAANYLNSLRPNTSPKAPLGPKPVTSAPQKAAFHRALDIANKPLIVLDSIKSGRLTSTDVVHMQRLYPALYARMSQKLMNEVTDLTAKGGTVPYATRIAISRFLAQPLDSSLSPASIMAAQPQPQAPEQASPSAPASSPKRSTSSLSKWGQAAETQSQARAARSNRQ